MKITLNWHKYNWDFTFFFKQTVTVYFHAFVSPTLNFEKKKDNLYVVFGPECDDWDSNLGCVMKYNDSNRYFFKNSQVVLTCYIANSFKVYNFLLLLRLIVVGIFVTTSLLDLKKMLYCFSMFHLKMQVLWNMQIIMFFLVFLAVTEHSV